MSRSAAIKAYANFSGGLVTEANLLSYPENAASALMNLDLNEDGSISRRAGIQFDSGDTYNIPAGRLVNDTATNVFKWESVNGDPNLNIAVIQIGDSLYFYYIKDGVIISATPAADPMQLVAPTRTSNSTADLRFSSDVQGVSGGGRFYVAGKYIDPFVLVFQEPVTQYDKGSLDKTTLVLKIRDFEIWKEGETAGTYSLAGEKRQDQLTSYQAYNLYNQGWPSDHDPSDVLETNVSTTTENVMTSENPNSAVLTEIPHHYTYDELGFYPTTADSYNAYQNGGGDSIKKQVAFQPYLMENDYLGNTPAPRGRFIKEAFWNIRSSVGRTHAPIPSELLSHYNNTEVTIAYTRPETIEFYAGRIWYAGLQGDQFTNNLYYSQVIGDDITKASKCYQEADPTNEVVNELIATDGGVFNLEEVGKIFKLYPIGPSLAIIAENGVWVISGDGEFSSFTATSFSVRKITSRGAVSAKSIVFANDSIYYWGKSAIYRLELAQQGAVSIRDISSERIKTRFQQAVDKVKNASFSVFDEGANRILWFYSDSPVGNFTTRTNKALNKVLYFDATLEAFGEYTIMIDEDTLPCSAISFASVSLVNQAETVVDGGVAVTDGAVDVTVSSNNFVSDASTIKVLTLDMSQGANGVFRFSEFTDVDDFEDWGTDSPAYFKSGFDSITDILNKSKQAPMFVVHMKRTETGFEDQGGELVALNQSGCLISYTWDWGDVYKNSFQAYKLLKNYTPSGTGDTFEYDRDVITTRNRIRGRGTSLGIQGMSEAGKDMKLLGYGILYTVRGRP